MSDKFQHFYKNNYRDRLEIISDEAYLTPEELAIIGANNDAKSGELVENYLTNFGLPEGIATNLVVNGRSHLVPMVVEEPSVIAACSNGAKLFAGNKDGITTSLSKPLVEGQIIIDARGNEKQIIEFVTGHEDELLQIANQSHPSVLNYGRGAVSINAERLTGSIDAVSAELLVDTGEAMGANIVNTMLEAIASRLTEEEIAVKMAILTNSGGHCLVTATGKVAIDRLASDATDGELVANDIVFASQVATVDSKRAVTNNKGIMNGVDAAAIAFGNDWRAIEAAVHEYAAKDGNYRGLSKFEIINGELVGTLTIPIPVGFVGGATKVLSMVSINKKIAGINNRQEEMELLAAVGLAQNLAAIKAIVTDGIQKGHLNLVKRSLALSNGATVAEIPQILAELKGNKKPTSSDIKTILLKLRSGK
ncbi:hydroxymethylglutaryl-CoA reductase, degradative [Lentilactobacillus sp. Marseille-Q4993]|uniref:hydroxymethylglutaryl-CoA reductase, degradative n=1 Tax=Lentilactobacillus sp. Marseille-Q4993 TaxID=3039492 RepID=UPI0024BD2660|nr:hydroxymethylglutaryl-CoA reductase, degradative [Lentilactobacillus sp. Marseille-Q4993]